MKPFSFELAGGFARRVICILSALMVGCTAVDYSGGQMRKYDNATSYHVTDLPNGMKIAVRSDKYQFATNPLALKDEGLSALRFIAREQAAQRGRTIQPIRDEDIMYSTGRNVLLGTTTWSATAIVLFSD